MHNKVNLDSAKNSKTTIKRLWKYMKKYKYKIILVLFFICLSLFFSTLGTLVLTPIVDNYIIPMINNPSDKEIVNGLIKQLILLVSFAFLSALFTYLRYRITVKISAYTVKDMRNDLFNKIQKLPIKFFDKNDRGELMSRITNDLDNVTMALNTSIDSVISAVLSMVIALAFMISISFRLSLISIISVPLILVISGIIMKLTKKQFIKQQECLGELNSYIEEHISGQKVIKAFNHEEQTKKEFSYFNEKLKKEGFKAQAYGAIAMPIMGSINNIATALIYTMAGIFALKGDISIGMILTFSRFSSQFSQPISETAQQIPTIEQAIAGAERMFQIIDEEIEFPEAVNKPNLNVTKGNVEFKNVSFSYDKKTSIIKNFNLKVKAGEMVAFVGPTGAGKTTIINLLTRFYDVDFGEILIDGVNIKDVNFYSLRESLGIVLQDTVLFQDTVLENIRFGKLDASEKEIKDSAKLANADNFITKLKNGYNEVLNEDTTNISVGQKQLLNISRVILNNPKILVLDEATSNVDTRTEIKINDAMNNLMKNRTSFVIAHRLSTIRKADKIVVIDDGEIVEIGNHKELIEKKGMYYNMYTGMFDKRPN